MFLTVYVNDKPINIECQEDQMYYVRQRARSFFPQEDTDTSVWKCTLYREEGDHRRVVGDEEKPIHQPPVLYATIRELHGIKKSYKSYDYMKNWNQYYHLAEEAYDYLIYDYDKLISNNIIRKFEVIKLSGSTILHQPDIEASLILWISQEKDRMFNQDKWDIEYQQIDVVDVDSYLCYDKMFMYNNISYMLAIDTICCYCNNNCSYCHSLRYTEFRFILISYGNNKITS